MTKFNANLFELNSCLHTYDDLTEMVSKALATETSNLYQAANYASAIAGFATFFHGRTDAPIGKEFQEEYPGCLELFLKHSEREGKSQNTIYTRRSQINQVQKFYQEVHKTCKIPHEFPQALTYLMETNG